MWCQTLNEHIFERKHVNVRNQFLQSRGKVPRAVVEGQVLPLSIYGSLNEVAKLAGYVTMIPSSCWST